MDGFAALRAAVAEDGDARARLRAAVSRPAFTTVALELAQIHGIQLAPADLERRLDAPQPSLHRTAFGLERAAAEPEKPIDRVPDGFAPVAFDPSLGVVRWCDMTGLDFREPFLEETITRALREPYRRLFSVSTRPLAPFGGDDSLPIAGLIFHTSRCGSTLVCQQLRAAGSAVVVAEPPVVEHVLRSHLESGRRVELLAWVLAGLSRRWRPGDLRTVIKLDAWATRDMELLLRAGGDPPWAFLFREPEAVVASQLRLPGLVGAAGLLAPELFGLDLQAALSMPAAEYVAAVYARLAEDILARPPGSGCLVDYQELPEGTERLVAHFGWTMSPAEHAQMLSAAGRNAKRPDERFDPAQDAKVTPEVQRAVQAHATGTFARLESGCESGLMDKRVRLPLEFDPRPLLAEVQRLSAEEWIPHFNTAYYEGDWSGISLRSVGGRATTLYPDPAASEPFATTPTLGRCPALAAALARLECELLSARLLRLGPGSRILEHRDHALGYDDGEIRLHVPLSTEAGVEFRHDGDVVAMAPGECWYMDLNLPHAVANRSANERIHLVVDCVVDPWLERLLARPQEPTPHG